LYANALRSGRLTDTVKLEELLRNLRQAGLPFTFGTRDKQDLRPLQTADLWAYEAWRRAEELYKDNPRPIRQSLVALVEDQPNILSLPLGQESLLVLFQTVTDLLANPA
jgi:hypothetical protein